MEQPDPTDDLQEDIKAADRDRQALAALFGDDIVEQAGLVDIATLNLTDDITKVIADGVRQLKQLRGDTSAQQAYINELPQGSRLLLCMWVMDMNLLDSIR